MATESDNQTPLLGDMPVEEFRRYGHEFIDWIADYLANIDQYPVLAQVEPGQIAAQLPRAAPVEPESMAQIRRDLEELIVPGLTHWNHPSFHGYFAISGSGPGILAELLSAAFNINGMLWQTSPAATELETVTLDWLRQMLGLPAEFEGIIYDTASIATLHALATAREALNLQIREAGLSGRPEVPRLRVYASEQAHSAVDKAAILLGIGQAGVRKIPVDAEFRMRPEALAAAIAEDRAAGWQPFCVLATVGTTSTTSIDPVPALGAICREHNLWLHVDAAYAGPAAILPERRDILAGCEQADSLVVNPHKWLFTPIDLSVFYCRRLDLLKQAFSLVPEYLRTAQDEVVRNYMDYGIQLGRRFRSLKLWFVLRYFGEAGLVARLREQLRLAQELRQWLEADSDFELLAPVPFSLVCFRYRPQGYVTRLAAASAAEHAELESDLNRLNEALLKAVNATGRLFISHTKLGERFTLRFAIGNIKTTEAHIRASWELIRATARQLNTATGA